jgi:small conductance mechanosensitive channel
MDFIEEHIWIISRILYSIIAIGLCFIAIRLINFLALKVLMKARRMDEGTAHFILRIAKVVEWLIMCVIILVIFDVSLGPLLASLGIAGLIIGFALKDVLGNLSAGLMILVYKPFIVGDFIEIGNDIKGTVRDIGLSALEIKTFGNEKMVIPNSAVWGNPITNFTAYPTRKIIIELGIPYKAKIDTVVGVISRLLKADARVLDEPEFNIVVSELGNSGVTLSIRAWVKNSDYWDAVFDLKKGIKENLEKSGISIPFQQMDVHLKKG